MQKIILKPSIDMKGHNRSTKHNKDCRPINGTGLCNSGFHQILQLLKMSSLIRHKNLHASRQSTYEQPNNSYLIACCEQAETVEQLMMGRKRFFKVHTKLKIFTCYKLEYDTF